MAILHSFCLAFHKKITANNRHKIIPNYSCGINQLCCGEACRHKGPNADDGVIAGSCAAAERQPDLDGRDRDTAALHNQSGQVWRYFQPVLKSKAKTFGVWTCDGGGGNSMFHTSGAADDGSAGQLYLIG